MAAAGFAVGYEQWPGKPGPAWNGWYGTGPIDVYLHLLGMAGAVLMAVAFRRTYGRGRTKHRLVGDTAAEGENSPPTLPLRPSPQRAGRK